MTAANGNMIVAAEVAHMLGMSQGWVMRRFRAGEIPGHKFGRGVRFDEGEILAYIASRRRGPAAHTPDGGR